METALANHWSMAFLSGAFFAAVLLAGLGSALLRVKRIKHEQLLLVDKINQLLPQTQCGQCGFEGCRPYARAISQGEPINQCPPGGSSTLIKLAELVNDDVVPLNPAHGAFEKIKVAVIREDECIGCTKCIKACPVDAILGGPKLMHTVIGAECTGCDLCVEPCPVDCIDMVEVKRVPLNKWGLPTEISNQRQYLENLS